MRLMTPHVRIHHAEGELSVCWGSNTCLVLLLTGVSWVRRGQLNRIPRLICHLVGDRYWKKEIRRKKPVLFPLLYLDKKMQEQLVLYALSFLLSSGYFWGDLTFRDQLPNGNARPGRFKLIYDFTAATPEYTERLRWMLREVDDLSPIVEVRLVFAH